MAAGADRTGREKPEQMTVSERLAADHIPGEQVVNRLAQGCRQLGFLHRIHEGFNALPARFSMTQAFKAITVQVDNTGFHDIAETPI